MAGFLPKDYVGVSTRVDQFHAKYPKGSIKTTFTINDSTAIFSCTASDGEGREFTGHSFGQVGREKAFEKLETVSVGRALAFMGFETQSGIASKEEMEIFNSKRELIEIIEDMREEQDINRVKVLYAEALELKLTDKQRVWLDTEKEDAKIRLITK